MNAKIWGAIAVALVLGACGAKQEEAATEATPEATPPAAEVTPAPEAAPVDPAATDPAATDPAATTEPTTEEPAPAQ